MRALLLLSLFILLLAAFAPADALQYERAHIDTGWWRLPTSFLVHWNPAHAAANAASLALLAILAAGRPAAPAAVATAALICPWLLHAGLTDLTAYRGASPLVAAALPVGLIALWQRGRWSRAVCLTLAIAAAWQGLMQASGQSGATLLPPGVRPTWELHLAGFAVGSASAAVAAYLRRSSKPSS